jgi:hypothetical protein
MNVKCVRAELSTLGTTPNGAFFHPPNLAPCVPPATSSSSTRAWVEQPSAAPALAALGTRSPLFGKVTYRVAFWVPLPPDKLPKLATAKRDPSRTSIVQDVQPNELAAIRDGVIEEIVLEVTLPLAPPVGATHEEARDRTMIEGWSRLARHRLGFAPKKPTAPLMASDAVRARDFKNRRLTVL